jgi:hypothetical protein
MEEPDFKMFIDLIQLSALALHFLNGDRLKPHTLILEHDRSLTKVHNSSIVTEL